MRETIARLARALVVPLLGGGQAEARTVLVGLSSEGESLGWRTFAELWQAALASAIEHAAGYTIEGSSKKAAVMDAMSRSFDALWPLLVTPWWLVWLKWPGVRAAIKQVLLLATDGLLEWTYHKLKSLDVLNEAEPA